MSVSMMGGTICREGHERGVRVSLDKPKSGEARELWSLISEMDG